MMEDEKETPPEPEAEPKSDPLATSSMDTLIIPTHESPQFSDKETDSIHNPQSDDTSVGLSDTTSSGMPIKSDENHTDKSQDAILPAEGLFSEVNVVDVSSEESKVVDAPAETEPETDDKEAKVVNRELKSLIDSAKESKIISEFTQTKTKMRKSKQLDVSSSSLCSPNDAEKIQLSRRSSNNSAISNSSDLSEITSQKRSMRSLNPEFVYKNKKFLSTLTGRTRQEDGPHGVAASDYSDDEDPTKNDTVGKSPAASADKKSKSSEKEKKSSTPSSTQLRSDEYCWRCHWMIETNGSAVAPGHCSVCPRSYHPKCLGSDRAKACIAEPASWVCTECMTVLHAENSETRSPALQKIPVSMLCALLKHALKRMMEVNGVEPFLYPVDRTQFPDYDKHVVRPMDLSLIQQNIAAGLYGSTEAFLADVMWILHNTFIFNTSAQSRLTGAARSLVRTARIEMGEIEACPECYAAAHARRPTWFTDVCSTPHLLLWAKLKGFPYWPAKGMSVSAAGMVDVRFFGAHDRAWVPARDCFLYSEKDPNNYRTKRQDIIDSVQEVEQHIRNISRKFGPFVHAPYRAQFDPTRQAEQLRMMVPGFQGMVPSPKAAKEAVSSTTSSPAPSKPKRPRTKSKDPKEFYSDGSCSEEDEPLASQRRKMADGAEIAREEEDSSSEHDKLEKPIELDISMTPEKNPERGKKRRQSELQEAVITVLEKSDKRARRSSSSAVQLVEATLDVLPPRDKDNNKKTEGMSVLETKADDAKGSTKKVNTPIKEIDNQDMKKNEKTQEQNIKSKYHISSLVKEYKKIFPSSRDITHSSNISHDESTKNMKQKSDDENQSGDERKKGEKKNKADETWKLQGNSNSKVVNEKELYKIYEKSTDNAPSPKAIKDRILFSEDVERNDKKSIEANKLPTISNVISLSAESNTRPETTEQSTSTAVPIVEANSDSSVFKASEAQAASLKDAKAKLQKLRNAVEQPPPRSSPRVNVRPFARTKSPIEMMQIDVEIKAEPIDYDESAKSASDKNDLLSSLNLRPTNATDVEPCQTWNDVIRQPKPSVRRVTIDPNERPRARKTFPQPRRTSPQAEEMRAELNGKNSMVYIPIQPATSAAPLRMVRPPHRTNGPTNTSNPQRTSTVTASVHLSSYDVTSTVPPPLLISSVASPPPLVMTSSSTSTASRVGGPANPQVNTRLPAPSVSNMIPVISTVNGQWTFLQPINMETNETLMVNGTSERTSPDNTTNNQQNINRPATLTPINSTSNNSNSNNTNSSGRELPPLTPRPRHPLDPATPIGPMPTPSIAGPATLQLNQNAIKLSDYFRKLLTDSLEMVEDPAATIAALKLQLEDTAWRHKQELAELKHNADLQVLEMRASLEKEKKHALAEARRVWEQDLTNTVNLAKNKQWCANCRQEAQFYCCWNTSYCDYACQRAHWAQHYAVCTQQRTQEGTPSATDEPSQLAAGRTHEIELKTCTTGSKSLPTRVYGSAVRAATSQGTTLMLNVSGPSMGPGSGIRYSTPRFTQQTSNFVINKQFQNNSEEPVAKITPGGYLIVGASSSGQPAVVSHNRGTPPA